MIAPKLKAMTITLLVIGAVTTGVVISAAQGNNRRPSPFAPDRGAATSSEPGDATAPQGVDQKKALRAGSAGSSSPAKGSEGSATRSAAGGGGQTQSGPGIAGMIRRQRQIDSAVEGGGASSEAADEFENRLTIAHLAAAIEASDSTKNEALLKRLDEPMAMSFAKPTPLADVLKHIKTATSKSGRPPLPIYVDPKGLKDADVTPDSQVVIDLEGVPLKTSLRLVLKQIGLAYCLRDGVVIISSVKGVREELAEAARELLGSGNQEIDIPMLNHMGILGGGMGGMGGTGGMGGGGGMM